MLGPVVELAGYAMTAVGVILHLVSLQVAMLFFVVSILFGVLLSMSAVVLEEFTMRRYPSVSDLGRLLAAAVLENFGYRQLLTFWRSEGVWDALRGKRGWGAMERRGFQRDAAALTLDALARLVRPDGGLWFSYSTANSWPDESDHDSAMVRAGSIGWVGYALSFYLAHAPPCPAINAGCVRERASLLAAAVRLGNYLLSLEATEPDHPARGLLRQGHGTIRLAYRPEAHG